MLRGLDLLVATRNHIAMHPEESDQETWASRYSYCSGDCGSTYCAAGTAVVLAGDQIVWESFPLPTNNCIDVVGNTHSIMARAAELLGLSEDEERQLFFCSTGQVLFVLDQLIASRQEVSDERIA